MNNLVNSYKFSIHNKKNFSKPKNIISKKKVIFVEFNRMSSSIISYSYLTNILSKKYKSQIFAYRLTAKKNLFKDFLWKIASKIRIFNTFQVYKSFGVNEFFNSNTFFIKSDNLKKISKIKKKIHSKEDLLNLKVNNIYIGDLIYDSYLKNYLKATINLKDKNFNLFLEHSLNMFLHWIEVFKKYDVKSVVVSHSVYTLAIPLRIAISKNISAFQCNMHDIYRLSKKNLYAYREFFEYKNKSKQLDLKIKKKAIQLAKQKIQKKFSGTSLSLGASVHTSAYRKKFYKKILQKSNKTKILIATHCFFDNPHPYGLHLFVDFYEWLEFLGKLSSKTNFDWYIKLHPDYIDGTKKIILDFIDRYPNINYIPSKYSHHQLISEGIDVALTCWGSIAHEYPIFKKTVINCSRNNPHINYDFSLHPKTVEEYKNMILNLDKFKIKINQKKIHEFYAMHFVLQKDNWMIDKFDEIVHSKEYGYNYIFTSNFYDFWMNKEFNINKHERILENVSSFVDSKDYLMGWNKKNLNKFCAE